MAGDRRPQHIDVRTSAAPPQQGPPEIRGRPALPALQPPTLGCASPEICAAVGARSQSQRRIYRAALPNTSSAAPSVRQRSALWEAMDRDVDPLEIAKSLWAQSHAPNGPCAQSPDPTT